MSAVRSSTPCSFAIILVCPVEAENTIAPVTPSVRLSLQPATPTRRTASSSQDLRDLAGGRGRDLFERLRVEFVSGRDTRSTSMHPLRHRAMAPTTPMSGLSLEA